MIKTVICASAIMLAVSACDAVSDDGYLTSETDPTVNDLANASLSCSGGDVARFNAVSSAWECSPGSVFIPSGGNGYYDAGNIGIGTTTPDARLQVKGDSARVDPIAGTGICPGPWGECVCPPGTSWLDDVENFLTVDDGECEPAALLVPNGSVGIGIDNPIGQRLHVFGSVRLTRTSPALSEVAIIAENGVATWLFGNGFTGQFIIRNLSEQIDVVSIANSSTNELALFIDDTGQVGIGLDILALAAKLQVNGGLRLATLDARPPCSSVVRGTFWFERSNPGVADTVSVCGKTAGDTCVWQALAVF